MNTLVLGVVASTIDVIEAIHCSSYMGYHVLLDFLSVLYVRAAVS